MCQEFWDAHKEFQDKTGVYAQTFIWKIAEDYNNKAYEWHARYSIRHPVLCKLAMIVLSKPLGIGSSERSWKDVKKILSPTRNRTQQGRSVKMTTIVGKHCADKADVRF